MMRSDRTIWRWTAPMAALLLAAGCGGGGDAGGEAGGGEEAGAAPMEHPVDAATAGAIRGTITFTGSVPAPEPIDMSEEEVCAEKHAEAPMRHAAIVGAEGGLANVFVYVKSGLAEMQFPQDEPEVLDQEGCIYLPHVLALHTGQELAVRNSDDVLHNVNATPETNRGFNRGQPTSGMEFTHSFPLAEVMIPVRCDVHGWMQAFIGVTDHPYHTVSDGNGVFNLDRLPPGEYEIEAWHETYGTATQMVTVPESGEVEVSFEFTEEMAGSPVPLGPALIIDHEAGTLRRAVEATEELPQ